MGKQGRPTEYKKEYDEQAEKLCKLGAIDTELADFFNVSEQTINTWKKKHPTFLESIKRGKEIADMEVANSLYKKATGYTTDDVKIFQYEGMPVKVPYIKEYQPDTTSIIFWLKNRRPDKWRDKTEHDVNVNEIPEIKIVKAE
jgi:hypothetical protein